MLSPDWLSAEMKVHVLMFGDSGGWRQSSASVSAFTLCQTQMKVRVCADSSFQDKK